MIRVLLADDHGVLRDGLRRLLEVDPGIRVVATAGDGAQAVAQAMEAHPDVVVMDLSMPRMGGIEATRTLLQRLPGTGVVVLSMHSAPDTVALALEAGARGYLLKEAAGEEVAAAVRAVAGGARYLGQGVAPGPEAPAGSGRAAALTESERRILRLVAEGRSSVEAARILGLSPRTVETYRGRLMEKLQLDSVPALVKFAIRHDLTSID